MENLTLGNRSVRILLSIISLGLFVQLTGFLFNNDGSRYATQLYLLLFLPALILLLQQHLAFSFWRQLPAFLFFALMSWLLVVSMLNEGSVKGLAYWLKVVLLTTCYVFAIGYCVSQPKRWRVLVICVAITVSLFAFLTLLYQFAVLDKVFSYEGFRANRLSKLGWNGFADLEHPVVAGLYFGVFAVVLCWLFVSTQLRAWQAIVLVCSGICVLAYVMLTFSRGAWFSTAAGCLVLLLMFPNIKSRILLFCSLIAVLLGVGLFWVEFQAEQKMGVSGRTLIWRTWLQRLPDFWLLGAGAGADFPFNFRNGFKVVHAHSLYLQLWYELGIIGFILFVLFLFSLLWKGWTCRKQPVALLGLALLVYALVAMVTDVYSIFSRPSPNWVVFWLPVGILLGITKEQALENAGFMAGK